MKLVVFVTLACLGIVSGANAERGKNADGKCVTECSRSGGRPCPPCPPTFDPEAIDNEKKIADFELANESASESLEKSARVDSDYSSTDEYKRDRELVKSNKRIAGDLRELNDSVVKSREH